MFYRVRRKINYVRISAQIRQKLVGQGVLCDSASDFQIVTQLCSDDVYLALAALISFSKRLKPKKVTVLDDGTLTRQDYQLLGTHIPSLEIFPIKSIDTGRCPKGGTWERLVFCVRQAELIYTIQLDADTLTVGEIPEVGQATKSGSSFVFGTNKCGEIVNRQDAAKLVADIVSNSVQILAEKELGVLPSDFPGNYIRGCSAFAGFGEKSSQFDLLEKFSMQMMDRVGQDWLKWGSEQVASNYLLANSSAIVVGEPIYLNYYGQSLDHKFAFIHFIGANRFKNSVYRRSIENELSLPLSKF